MSFRLNQYHAQLMLFGCMLAVYFFTYFHRVGIPATIFNELQTEFAISAGTVTMIGSIFMFIYGGLQLPVGLLVDRLGIVPMFGFGGALLSIGSLGFPLAPSLGWLYLARIMIALGASFIYLSLVKMIDRWFDSRNFTIVLGVLLFFGYAGGLMGTWPLECAARAFGWRLPLLAVGLVCLLFYVLSMAGLKRMPRRSDFKDTISPALPLLANIKGVLRNSYLIHIASSVNFGIYFLLQAAIGKKMLEDCCGLRSSEAAAFIFAMTLISMACNCSVGWLSRLLGDRRRPILITATLMTGVAAALLVAAIAMRAEAHWFMTALVLLAVSSSAAPVFNSSMRELNRPDNVGAAVGLNNAACYLVMAVIIMLAGVVMDQFGSMAIRTPAAIIYPPAAYCVISLGCLVLAVGSMLSSWLISESWGRYVMPAANRVPVE